MQRNEGSSSGNVVVLGESQVKFDVTTAKHSAKSPQCVQSGSSYMQHNFKLTSESLIDLLTPQYAKSGSWKEGSSQQNLNMSDLMLSRGQQVDSSQPGMGSANSLSAS